MKNYWFSVEENNAVIVLSYLKEMGITAREMTPRRTSRFGKKAGPGFGDMVWRVNCPLNRIEASFAKPCAVSRSIKAYGFRWEHESGVWYAPNADEFGSILNNFGLRQIEHVTAR